MHDLVDAVGGYARLDGCGGNVENFAGETADCPHAFLLLLVEYGDVTAVKEAVSWVAICSIIWVLD